MSIETYQFNLPITPGAIPPVLHLSQYDSGRTFTAILRDDQGVPFELASSATAVIKGRNAAGIAWQQNCTVSGANVTFTPSGAATDQFGVMPVTIEITESDEIVSPLCVVFHIQKAGYTNEEAVLSPDFETAIQAAVAQAIAEGGLGFSDEFKEALLACFNAVAWATTGGQSLVDDLEAALYPDVNLVSITAAYDQDRPIYDADTAEENFAKVELDLVVTANYSDGTSEAVTGYTLSGTFTEGTSTITVTYQGKTTTISVLVLHADVPSAYTVYDYISYIGQDVQGTTANNVHTATYDNLNALVIEFDWSPSKTKSSATAILGGQSDTGNTKNVSFFGRTDSKRVSAFSHGTAIGIDNNDGVVVGGVVHVKLDPGSSSPSTLYVDSNSQTGAWTNSNTVNAPIGYCGTYGTHTTAINVYNFAQIGVLVLKDLSGNLVGKYVPVKRNADNVLGIYDSVAGVFHTANNTDLTTEDGASCVWAVGNWGD